MIVLLSEVVKEGAESLGPDEIDRDQTMGIVARRGGSSGEPGRVHELAGRLKTFPRNASCAALENVQGWRVRRSCGELCRMPARFSEYCPAVILRGFFTMRSFIFAGLLALAGPLASARTTPPPEQPETPQPRVQRTQHELRLDGQVIKYTATVGWLILKRDEFGKKEGKAEKDGKDPGEKPIARFGYTAYTLDDVKDASRRPVTFAFNGGPGSSSIWLHMAVLGPKRVVVKDGGYAPPPPVQLVDNEFTILDATDIVLIDPVGTGFSKPLGEPKARSSGASTRTSNRSAHSSSAMSRKTAAGARRNTCWARATAGSGARGSRTTSSRGSA